MLKKCEECKRSRLELCNAGCYNKAAKNKGGYEMETEINNVQVEPVPYIAHEAEMARIERANKLWFVAWLVTFVLLVGCVAGFIWYEAQFEDITITAEQQADGDSNNYAVGGDFYGIEAESDNQAPNP